MVISFVSCVAFRIDLTVVSCILECFGAEFGVLGTTQLDIGLCEGQGRRGGEGRDWGKQEAARGKVSEIHFIKM